MRCLKAILAGCCLSWLSPSAEAARLCVLFCIDEAAPAAADGFCQAYRRVIVRPGDDQEIGRAAPELRRRIAANEVLYRCSCEHWNNPICRAPGQSK
jgi:hypothetical protein